MYRAFESDICTSLCNFTELHEVLAEEFPWFSTNVYFGECDSISSLQILLCRQSLKLATENFTCIVLASEL